MSSLFHGLTTFCIICSGYIKQWIQSQLLVWSILEFFILKANSHITQLIQHSHLGHIEYQNAVMVSPSVFFSFIHSQYFATIPQPKTSWTSKTVIVTGSNTGLGLEAARHFVRLGAAKVIIAVRSAQKGETAKKDIIASEGCSPTTIEVWSLDLQSFDSVRAFAKQCETLDRIDAVVENAGIATQEYRLAEGHESTITTNVISTFLLALLLLPQLKTSAKMYNTKPHLTIVSSEVHYFTNFPERKAPAIFTELDNPKTARMTDRYNVSKLLEVYICRELVKEYMSSSDYPVVLNFMNPGLCKSELGRENAIVMRIIWFIFRARTSEVGSRTLVHAASAGTESHGEFLSDCKPKTPALSVVGPEGPTTQKKVWDELKAILEKIQPGVTNNL
jgi:retinol dehydrogenase-12